MELKDFEWDMAKSDLCQISRNFDFTYVMSIFIDSNLLIEKDQRWDYGEERFRALGLLDEKVFVVIYTKRPTAMRIISARRANRREVRRYEENHSS
ncbi:BrnT family toxin [Polynucleobacter sp. AP-Sving-400A-A2]|uniref:BrnT family toxin n=1 Tax=Polynucleobacter sp. AP-Sving-400A-A2 TaxID=2081049 RepID=UPI001BFCFD05|nr:BrnT family toxin [Polynucleobacter sp. AP-Sving-400A-A2]QWE15126.1 BrnT family toxin [Polynucleobacter sp. AP-Sving-400A-A2]